MENNEYNDEKEENNEYNDENDSNKYQVLSEIFLSDSPNDQEINTNHYKKSKYKRHCSSSKFLILNSYDIINNNPFNNNQKKIEKDPLFIEKTYPELYKILLTAIYNSCDGIFNFVFLQPENNELEDEVVMKKYLSTKVLSLFSV